jgi:Tol biopolymer transport system component
VDFASCPKCGAFNAPDAVACEKCKSPLDAEPETAAPIAFKPMAAPAPVAPPPEPAAAAEPKTAAFARPGLAQRPPRPPMPVARPAPMLSRGRIIALAAALVAVAVVVKLVAFPSTRLLVGGGVGASTPVWSPTGKHLAFLLTDERGAHLGVYDFASKSHKVAGDIAGGGGDAFSWSPDGKRIAYAGTGAAGDWMGAIHVYDVAAGSSKTLAAGSSPQFRADGSLVAVCGPDRGRVDEYAEDGGAGDFQSRFCRIDPDAGTVTRLGLAADYGMALSPLVDRVVFERYPETAEEGVAAAGGGGDVEFQRMADAALAGRATNVVEGNRDLNRALEAKAARDKRRAAKGATRVPADADVFAADLSGAPAVRVLAAGEAAYPKWTAAGDRILFAANGAGGVEIFTVRDDGSDRRPVLAGVKIADPEATALSADGKLVFFVSPVEGDPGMAKLMTGEAPADLHVAPAGGGPATRLSNKHPYKHRFAVSPDGKRVAYEVLADTKMLAGTAKSEIWLMNR